MRRRVPLVLPLLLLSCGGDTVTVTVPNEVMAPTVRVGQEVEIDRDAYSEARPKVGEVVLFAAPKRALGDGCAMPQRARQACPAPARERSDVRSLMRIVAGPGDTLAFRHGRAIVNGKPEERGSVRVGDPNCARCNLPVAVTVPDRHFFLAGDNRSAATDSRDFGAGPRGSGQGRVSE